MRGCGVTAWLLVAVMLPRVASGAFESDWADARSAALFGPGSWAASLCTDLPPSRAAHGRWDEPGGDRSDDVRWALRCDAGELFGLHCLRTGGVSVERIGRRTRIGFAARQLGGRPAAERTAAAVFGWRLSEEGSACLRARVLDFGAAGYAPEVACAVDASVSHRLLGSLTGRATVTNLFASSVAGARVPQSMDLGLDIAFKDALVTAGSRIEPGFDASLHVGVEIRSAFLRLRAGAQTTPDLLALGLGLGRSHGPVPCLDVALQWHPLLGGSVLASLSWSF